MFRSFEDIFSDVPDKQRQEFVYFRQTHPPKYARVGDTNWRYLDSSNGDETLLLLVGGLRVADAAWKSMPMLEGDYRVITPTYPPEATMSALADGLAGMLDAINIDKVHVLAGSFGGMLAQVFVRRHPDRVNKLILSTTAVLDENSTERYQQALAMMQPLSDDEVATTAQQMMFDIIAPPEDMHAFYRAYLDELYTERLTKEDLISTYQCLIDFAENITFSASDLDGWEGNVLILESDDDATFDEDMRARVRGLYPHAETYTFEDAGHSPGTTQRDLYFSVVKNFLKKPTHAEV